MRPIVIRYAASNANLFVNNVTYITDLISAASATPVYGYLFNINAQIDAGTARNLIVDITDPSDATAVLQINGTNVFGVTITESLALPTAGAKTSVNAFASINTLTITTTTTDQTGSLQVGTAVQGQTLPQQMDIYNSEANYTIAYSNLGGTVAATPMYSVQQMVSNLNGNPVTYLSDTTAYYTIPIANTYNVVASPTTVTALPIAAACSLSFRFPISSLWTACTTTASGSFTQTILQQGAKC